MSYTNVVAGIGDAGGNSGWPGSPVPATSANMRKHLRRLERVWIDWPIYFVTTCTLERRSILASNEVPKILSDEWKNAHNRHGWAIGCYVIMPDHVHFFCSAELDAKTLPIFMQAWKQWTSKGITRELNSLGNIWQEEFFDAPITGDGRAKSNRSCCSRHR